MFVEVSFAGVQATIISRFTPESLKPSRNFGISASDLIPGLGTIDIFTFSRPRPAAGVYSDFHKVIITIYNRALSQYFLVK